MSIPCEETPYCARDFGHSGGCSPHPEELVLRLERVNNAAATLDLLDAVADRCGRREGESVAELLKRLYDETLND